MTRFNSIIATAVTLTGLMASPVLSEAIYSTWDLNDDEALTVEEFVKGFKERAPFDKWDSNGNGELSEKEITNGVYGKYDRNTDDQLAGPEYRAYQRDFGARGFWGRTGYAQDSNGWDVDGDGILLRNEFVDGFAPERTMAQWDTDNSDSLSEEEFARGVFRMYDENSDGVIDEPELHDIGDDMGDEGFWDV